MKRKIVWVLIVLVLFQFLLATIYRSEAWENILSPILMFLLFHVTLEGSFQHEKNKLLKTADFLLAGSMFWWFVCDLVWVMAYFFADWGKQEFAIFSNMYSGTNVLLLAALLVAGRNESKKWNGIRTLVDAIAISVSVMVLIWVVFFNKDMQNVVKVQEDVVAIASIGINFVMYILISVWFFSMKKRKEFMHTRIILGGMVFFIIIEFWYYYEYFFDNGALNYVVNLFYLIAFSIMALGAHRIKYTYAKMEGRDEIISGGNSKVILFFVTPLLLVIFHGVEVDYLMFLAVVLLIYLMIILYVDKNIHRDELLEQAQRLNESLGEKVKERTREINELLMRDVETGLFSRHYFLSQLDHYMEQLQKKENIMLLYIDLNKFRSVKSLYGNFTGEKVLQEFGRQLDQFVEQNNFENRETLLASYGADTFVLAIKGFEEYEDGIEIAQMLMEACSRKYKIQEYEIPVTMNIGISIYPLDAKSKEDLLMHSDMAMSKARLLGNDKVMSFNKEMIEQIFERNHLDYLMRKDPSFSGFILHFQPQVSCQNGAIVGAEALARWRTYEENSMVPEKFIKIAEDNGFIIPIGYLLMEEAIKQVAMWNDKYEHRLRIGINISLRQLDEPDFILRLKNLLSKYKVPAEQIELEFSEQVLVEKSQEIRERLFRIQNMGVNIAIDGFGSGYPALYYMKHLPVKTIKIARAITEHIHEDAFDSTFIQAAITIGRAKEVRMVAIGVESQLQWDCLREIGCDEIQGYFIGKPVLAETFEHSFLN